MSNLSLWKTVCLALVLSGMEAIALPAQTFSTLANFDDTDGAAPRYGFSPVQGIDGNFYGTASEGGANAYGTVFQVTPEGGLSTLHSFAGADGAYPYGSLARAANGSFYGITYQGGAHGGGTAFEITVEGNFTTLYSFCAQNGCADGLDPSSLIQANNGNLYGTTNYGGAHGAGTVFEISAEGTLTTLYSFCARADCTDGFYPNGLVQATNGDFYGTTLGGGANGYGTVFQITASGTLTTLHSFCTQAKCPDGLEPFAGLVQAANGNFYGTTLGGGTNGDRGTVFEITAGGALTTLHSFEGADGERPFAGLVQGTDGNFYGTTDDGGADGNGTAFEITAAGKLTTLHSFDGTDGWALTAGLVQSTTGRFYGTTASGGASAQCFGGCGTVFNLGVGLGPFVETEPTSGKVGAAVIILGTNLTGSTSVTFNGTRAAFKVISDSEISTAVPAGATTGKVQVQTPLSTLSSNVVFTVN